MRILRILILAVFFLSTLTLSVGTSFFNSPDENANFVFAEQFSDYQNFKIEESGNLELSGIIHPRSTIALSQFIVPVSFLGLSFIGGLFGSIFGNNIILWITPILAILAVLAWRSLVFKLTDSQRLADLSALFLIIHPAFWYYSARVMMHNVGFVSFLILAIWFAYVRPLKKDWLNWIGSGAVLGLALGFRSSEVIWVSVIAIVLFVVYKKFVNWKNIILFLISLVVILIGFGALNYATYGSMFQTGYTVESENSQIIIETEVTAESDALDHIINIVPLAGYLFPFGIHESNIARNVWNYGFVLYPWMTLLAIIGLLLVAREKKWQTYIWITVGLALWLAVVYGSWKFNDNPDASVVTLGNSYVRYWLPIFVLGSVFCALAVDRISKFGKGKWRLVILSTIVVLATISSGALVVFGEDGFIKTHQSLASVSEKHTMILDQTSEDSIIIVDMADKYLWPDRRVVTPLRSELTYSSIPKMLELSDVYYFGITLPQEDLDYLNQIKLKDLGAQIKEVIQISDETLYKITND